MPDFLVGLNGADLVIIVGTAAVMAYIAADAWRQVCRPS